MLAEDPELLRAFLDESQESLAGLESQLIELGRAADLPPAVDAIFRPVHSFKGNAPFFGFLALKRLAHAMETVLDHLRRRRLALVPAVTDGLLAGLDGLRAGLDRLRAGGPEVADPAGFEALVARIGAIAPETGADDPWRRIASDLAALELWAGAADPAVHEALHRLRQDLDALRGSSPVARGGPAPAAAPAKAEAEALPTPAPPGVGEAVAVRPPTTESRARSPDTDSHGKSMRVSESAVDGFLAHVGDLLVIGDQLAHLQRRLAGSGGEASLVRDMRRAVGSFTTLSSELQRNIMAVRKVMVRPLLQKAPRLVRDIAQAAGKDIAVTLRGEGVEVDKSRLDLLDAPLTHLVRNCADHGIEPPAERRAAGKPERGTISITVRAEDGWITLEIADDGRGLDFAAIRRKGESLGLVRPGQDLDERAVIDLIFAPGLSTAAKVSDVSGRGVGMDVVKRNVAEGGGSIGVSSERGRGTTFRLRVPSTVTTQIVPSYLVRTGDGIYAIALDRVRETFALPAGEEGCFERDGLRMVTRHGAVLPVLPLARLLALPAAAAGDAVRRTLVAVEHRGAATAIEVDEPLGVRQLVIRPISGMDAAGGGRFQGAALLGDGRLALVLDLDRLLAGLEARHG